MYFIEMFLEQWIMIAFQLKLLEWIIHKKMKFYKIFAASIFGSFSGCLILQLYDEDHGLKLGLMIISIVMTVKISCAFPMKKAWKYSVYLLVLSLFTGGIFTMIKSHSAVADPCDSQLHACKVFVCISRKRYESRQRIFLSSGI